VYQSLQLPLLRTPRRAPLSSAKVENRLHATKKKNCPPPDPTADDLEPGALGYGCQPWRGAKLANKNPSGIELSSNLRPAEYNA
jgi:hypothetical protein